MNILAVFLSLQAVVLADDLGWYGPPGAIPEVGNSTCLPVTGEHSENYCCAQFWVDPMVNSSIWDTQTQPFELTVFNSFSACLQPTYAARFKLGHSH